MEIRYLLPAVALLFLVTGMMADAILGRGFSLAAAGVYLVLGFLAAAWLAIGCGRSSQ